MKLRETLVIAVLLFWVVAPALAVEDTSNFTFTKNDLELLEQSDLLDQKYEREGLIYHDQALNSYVTQVGLSMLPAGAAPERVHWSFRILRDPVASALASDFVHPRLKEVGIRSVVVLPAKVEESSTGIVGTAGIGKDANDAAAYMVATVSTALSNRGLAVDSPFAEEALKGNDELRYALADVQRRFDDVAAQLFKHDKDVRKGRFTLGDSVAVLNTKGTADVLVIVRAIGHKETKGKAFMTGGLLGMALSGKTTFQSRVALVDAKNGDILFLGDYIGRGLPTYETYEKSFKSIPVSK
jgi:hypothetical protein